MPHAIATCGKMVNDLTGNNNEKRAISADRSEEVLRTSDLTELGYSSYDIRKLVDLRMLERVKQGYYVLASARQQSEAALIAKLFPDGVLCMNSALFYYRYSDRTPSEWDIAIDRDTSKSRFKLDYPFVHPYYMEAEYLSFGVTTAIIEDSSLMIFDRDRLICECVFHEKRMDRETYNKAIQGYIVDSKKNISRLLEYAQQRRILNKVKDRIGIWL